MRLTNNVKILKVRPIRTLFFAVCSLLAVATISAAQQRPLLTDDVDITPAGSLEIGAGVGFFQGARFPLSGINGDMTQVGNIRVRTGLASNVEIQLEGTLQNYVAINSIDNPQVQLAVTRNSTHDFGDATISTKIKIRNESRLFPAVGIKFGYQLPSSDQSKGIGTNQINIYGKIILQKSFGRFVKRDPKFRLFGNLGLGIMTDPLARFSQNDVWLYGLAGVYRATDRINIVGEINGRANTRPIPPVGTESLGQARVGAQIKASGLRFDTAASFGFTHNTPRTGLVFGVTYVSPTLFTPAK